MDERERLAAVFEAHRAHLRALAHRMLGSSEDADDAVQEAWLRLARSEVESPAAWLRTVVSRICYDMLRTRASRREDLVGGPAPDLLRDLAAGADPEGEAVLADSVGRALLVVLDTLSPAERVAFVLHDMFAVPFDRIAPVVQRTPATAKKLASRARSKVRGTPAAPGAEARASREVVAAFLAASRGGDLGGLLAVLAPDVVRRADAAAAALGVAGEVRGARTVAEETVLLRRLAGFAELALVNGSAGVVVAPAGRFVLALVVTVVGGRVAEYEVVADRGRLELGVLDGVGAVGPAELLGPEAAQEALGVPGGGRPSGAAVPVLPSEPGQRGTVGP